MAAVCLILRGKAKEFLKICLILQPKRLIVYHKMKFKSFLSVALLATLALTSCKKLGELSADNFTVTPSPLEAVAGQVPFTVDGKFPEKYMKKKAVVTVTPVLRYTTANGVVETPAQHSATFQGEKVQGNDQTISYKVGGNYTMRSNFAFVPEMAKSELYLKFDAKVGKKVVEVPAVKVADGVLATSTLISSTVSKSTGDVASDAFQYVIAQKKEAQIKYLIEQAKVRNSELKSTSIQDFIQTLRDIKADQKGFEIDNIDISAYASPDGGFDYNKKLAAEREKTSSAFVADQLKELELDAHVDTKYTAQDWEGFKELVANSNIQDKDVIVRVLSMYEDPEEREAQIRNLSAAFSELADEVLPELRRARLTVNYNIIGRSDDEIQAQYKNDASQLSVEELLYSATLTENDAEKEGIYKTTIAQYPADYRAYNNLGQLAIKKGDLNAAKNYLAQAAAKQGNASEVNANQALIAIAEGKTEEAKTYLANAANSKNYNEILGNLQVANGNYNQAAKSLNGVNTNSAALAQILNKDYATANNTLKAVSNPDGMTYYLKAIVAARTNQATSVVSNLQEAIAKDPSLKEKAASDIEFAGMLANAAFANLLK